MKQLLEQARQEIIALRRQNEILSAKVEMVDLFACVLHTQPARHSVSMGEDIAWKIERALEEMEPQKHDPLADGPLTPFGEERLGDRHE